MASGRLGTADLSAATNTTVYTVPSSTVASFAVNICNRNATPTTIRLALAAGGTPTDAEWLFYDLVLDGNASLERTGLVAHATMRIVAYSVSPDVSVQVYGYEEAA